jgi:hypothetical protein
MGNRWAGTEYLSSITWGCIRSVEVKIHASLVNDGRDVFHEYNYLISLPVGLSRQKPCYVGFCISGRLYVTVLRDGEQAGHFYRGAVWRLSGQWHTHTHTHTHTPTVITCIRTQVANLFYLFLRSFKTKAHKEEKSWWRIWEVTEYEKIAVFGMLHCVVW